MAEAENKPVEQQSGMVPVERGDSGRNLVKMDFDPTGGVPAVWSSMTPTTAQEKAKLFNALTGESRPVATVLGKPIDVQDIVIQGIEILDTKTGEMKRAPRIILLTPERATYACVSTGMFDAIKKLIALFGLPPWVPALTVIPKQVRTRQGWNVFTCDVAEDTIVQPPNPPATSSGQPPATKVKK